MDILGKIKDWLNLGAVPLMGVTIASGIVLFAPNAFLQTIGLDSVVAQIRPYLGGAFLLSISILLCMGAKKVWDVFLKPYIQEALAMRLYRRELDALTQDEKEILRPFIEKQTRAQYFSIQDGVVLGLEHRKIITRVGIVGLRGFDFKFPFQIQPWAWKYLNRHPELLD